jgi:alanine-glyoxylate transaminase/serine-glyoxylate transaminase/serine-pyruvate transaminase
MSFGGGLGAFQDRLFRIGHLGSTTESMVLSGLATAEMAMADVGVEFDAGSGVAAAQQVYRNGG